MHKCQVRFLLILFTVTVIVKAVVIPQQRKEIDQNVQITKIFSSPLPAVKIGNYSKIEIIWRGPTLLWMNGSVEKKHTFFTAVSCKFSHWTIHKIYDLLNLVQLSKPRTDKIHDNALVMAYKISISTFKADIDKYMGRFVGILNNILDTNSDVLYYSDTTILKTLVLLQIHVQLKNEHLEDDEYIIFAIRLLLWDMAELQRFSLINCLDLPSNINNSMFPAYWIQFDSVNDDIDTFFSSIKNITLEPSNPLICTATQMLLGNFVTLTTDDEISLDILNAKVKDNENTNRSIRDILNRIEKKYDSELIFLYQNTVLITIVKIIYSKILKFVQKPSANSTEISECITLFDELYAAVSSDSMYLPFTLVDGFEFLSAALKKNKKKTTEFSNYRIEIELNPKNVTNEMEYLKKMFQMISNNLDDLKCVRQYFKCLFDEHERYHVPFIVDKNNIQPIARANEVQSSEGLCEFIINIYTLCYECYTSSFSCTTEQIPNCKKTWELMNTLKLYFLTIIKHHKNDSDLLKMSYNIAMVLVNLRKPKFCLVGNIDLLQKSLQVIMSELISNHLNNCNSQNSNLLLFLNFKYMNSEREDSIENSIIKYFQNSLESFNSSKISRYIFEIDNVHHIELKFLLDGIINSNLTTHFKNSIRIYWEGALKTVGNIFEEYQEYNLNPKNVFALYDIYFKSIITAVYIEIIDILHTFKNDQNKIRDMFKQMSKTLKDFELKHFPKELERFFLNVKSCYDFQLPDEGEPIIDDEWNIKREKVEQQLRAYNIVTINNPKGLSIKFSPTLTLYESPKDQLYASLYYISEELNTIDYARSLFVKIEKRKNLDNR